MSLTHSTLSAIYTNQDFTYQLLSAIFAAGVTEFCICPGARNAPLVLALSSAEPLSTFTCHYWFEERSAAFFALGRSRATQRPVAVITTSGTAAAELLPATMEAHYSGVPLLLITADRPRRFRQTGAPQCAEQVGLFSCYTSFAVDVALNEQCNLEGWNQEGPAHLNICFDEPLSIDPLPHLEIPPSSPPYSSIPDPTSLRHALTQFLDDAHHPFVIVSSLQQADREAILNFLVQLKAPVFLEATSGLRESPHLHPFQIRLPDNILQNAGNAGYPIDRVLRIGGVPTLRLWRDLDCHPTIEVCSVNHLPFSGLSDGKLIQAPLKQLLNLHTYCKHPSHSLAEKWIHLDHEQHQLSLQHLTHTSEMNLVHQLSDTIPEGSLVYLGNSLPIREWDRIATFSSRDYQVYASRGVNGIDGQISTFLGFCQPDKENWAILGDLTTLYDMAGLWALRMQEATKIRIVVINNGGGQIFSKMFSNKAFLHEHDLSFEPLANMWNMEYFKLNSIPHPISFSKNHTLIEFFTV